jgi:bifunctional DNase/RNase
MNDMVRMELSKIIITETSEEQVIVLKEVDGDGRAFPIVIGIWEAIAINRYLNQQKTPRPMTHDLIGGVIRNIGFNLDRIQVNDLKDGVFYARLVLKRNGREVEVDSRPSDAIALAVQWNAPIFVSETVLEEAARAPEPPGFSPEEGGEGEEEPDEGGPGGEV